MWKIASIQAECWLGIQLSLTEYADAYKKSHKNLGGTGGKQVSVHVWFLYKTQLSSSWISSRLLGTLPRHTCTFLPNTKLKIQRVSSAHYALSLLRINLDLVGRANIDLWVESISIFISNFNFTIIHKRVIVYKHIHTHTICFYMCTFINGFKIIIKLAMCIQMLNLLYLKYCIYL